MGQIDVSPNQFYFNGVMARPGNTASDPEADLATRLGVPVWLVGVLVACIGFGAWAFVHLESRQSALDQAMADLPKQMAGELNAKLEKLRGDLKQIAGELDAKLEKLRGDLINEFFSRAQKFSARGDFRQAAAATNAAAILISASREKKVPQPDPTFFVDAVRTLNALAEWSQGPSILVEPVHRARVALAEYRSSLQTLPRVTRPTEPVLIPLNLQALMKLHGSGLIWQGPSGVDMLKAPGSVSGLYLAEGWQTLDGAEWDNVLFMDMHIRYKGGSMSLKNVIFVNCTFEVNVGPQEAKLLDYATLDLSSMRIG